MILGHRSGQGQFGVNDMHRKGKVSWFLVLYGNSDPWVKMAMNELRCSCLDGNFLLQMCNNVPPAAGTAGSEGKPEMGGFAL